MAKYKTISAKEAEELFPESTVRLDWELPRFQEAGVELWLVSDETLVARCWWPDRIAEGVRSETLCEATWDDSMKVWIRFTAEWRVAHPYQYLTAFYSMNEETNREDIARLYEQLGWKVPWSNE